MKHWVQTLAHRKLAFALAHAATGLIVGQGVVFYGLVLRARLNLEGGHELIRRIRRNFPFIFMQDSWGLVD